MFRVGQPINLSNVKLGSSNTLHVSCFNYASETEIIRVSSVDWLVDCV